MKTRFKKVNTLFVTGILTQALLIACAPKTRLQRPHEGVKSWDVTEHSKSELVALSQDLEKINLSELESLQADKNQDDTIIKKLSPFILDSGFTSQAKNLNQKLESLLRIFNKSFLRRLKSEIQVDKKQELLKDYQAAIFAGCSESLNQGCVNLRFFATDSNTSKILLLVATINDAKIDLELKSKEKAKSCTEVGSECQKDIDLRYRILALAFSIKASSYQDSDFAIAFIKYISIVDQLIKGGHDFGHLTQTYSSIFETLIPKLNIKEMPLKDVQDLIESFSPWTYSVKASDTFKKGSKTLFELATQCCLYADEKKQKLSSSFKIAIEKSQTTAEDGISFFQVVQNLGLNPDKTPSQLFKNLGLDSKLSVLTNLKSDFYDEHFYIIDRIFNEHLETSEALRILEGTDIKRSSKEFPERLSLYLKIRMAALTVDTTEFMASVYSSASLSSDTIFSEAQSKSRDQATKWMKLQTRIDILEKFMNSYFNRSAGTYSSVVQASDLLKSFNRNVHYLSVFPHMVGMTYILSKNRAVIKEKSYWGTEFVINPETIVEDLFDGKFEKSDVWFKFTPDTMNLTRERILYAIYYALKTETLEKLISTSITNENSNRAGFDRSKFFQMTIGKYLDPERERIANLAADFERNITTQSQFGSLYNLCRYEMSAKGSTGPMPTQVISFEKVGDYNYSPSSVTTNSGLMHKFFAGNIPYEINQFNIGYNQKITFVEAMISIFESHLIETGKINSVSDSNPELQAIRKILQDVKDKKKSFMTSYERYRKFIFDCGVRLQEVEMMRAYRIISIEKKRLEIIYDQLQRAATESGGFEKLNSERRKIDSSKFDTWTSAGYSLSQYDYFNRIKHYLEADVFTQVTDEEKEVYGAKVDELVRPRSVRVTIPYGIDRMEISTRSLTKLLPMNLSKQEFVNTGLRHLVGASTESYANWHFGAESMTMFKNYMSLVVSLYLMGPQEIDGGVSEVKPEELIASLKKVLGLVQLNRFDEQLGPIIGMEGRMKQSELSGFLNEESSSNGLPLLQPVMAQLYKDSGLGDGYTGLILSGRSLVDNLTSENRFIFSPDAKFNQRIMNIYQKPIQSSIQRVVDFYRYAETVRQDPELLAFGKASFRFDETFKPLIFETSFGRSGFSVVDEISLDNLVSATQAYAKETSDQFKISIFKRNESVDHRFSKGK